MKWPIVKLSEVAKIDRIGIEPSNIIAGTRYLGLEHIETGGRIIGTQTVVNGELASTKFQFDSGHVLYGKLRPYLAKIALPDFSGICSTDILPVRPGKNIDRKFLAHFLRLPQMIQLASTRSTGVNLPRLSPKALAEFDIPVPPLSEQKRIAAVLEKADGIRRKRENTFSMADEFLKSVFQDMFGDPVENIKGFRVEQIGDHLSRHRPGTQSGPFGSALKKYEYVEKGIPVWGVDNVQHNRFVGDAKLFITEEKYEQLQRYNVESGDILISRAGTVGRMCIAEPVIENSIISTNLIRVVLDAKSLLPEYFVSLFTYLPHRLGALKANNKDSAFTFLNPKTLKALRIPIPPIGLQEEYKSCTENIRLQLNTATLQLAGFSDLFASLSQRAFRGEL